MPPHALDRRAPFGVAATVPTAPRIAAAAEEGRLAPITRASGARVA